MKHLLRIRLFAVSIILAPVILAGWHSRALADVTVTYRFDAPAMEQAGPGFSRIVFPATVQAGRAGEPSFPFRGAAVLLPRGETITGVKVHRRGWKSVPGGARLYPRQDPVPGTDQPVMRTGREFLYRSDVYTTDAWIDPPSPEFTVRYLRGHAVATGSFSPVRHNPATGETGYWSEYEITLETGPCKDPAAASRLYRADAATIERLASLVDNPAALPAPGAVPAAGEGYDYLIITREYYTDHIRPLRDYHTARGLRTEIMTVEDIDLAWSGADLEEEIRMAITDAYVSDGIEYVLLAGDSDNGPYDLPHRGFFCQVQSSILYTEDIPADLYYGGLDGDWNSDGDTLFGEPGEEDFYQEVAVGRISFDDTLEAASIINKILMYQETPVASQCDDALMLGEHLYNDPLTYGGNEMDQLIGFWDIHGFATDGIPPSFDIVKLYERDISYGELEIRAAINAGTHLVCHSGHSNYTYVMKMTTSDITTANFTNDGVSANFPVIYSYGCNAGGFDLNDCIAEEMVSLETCASAYVGNSRYGWFTEGTTNGPSHHFQREFVDALFTEGITRLGMANLRSKDETVPFVDLPDEYEPGAHRWCFYALNVFGDPAMDLWTGMPFPVYATHDGGVARDAAGFDVSTDAVGVTGALSEDGVLFGTGVSLSDGSMTIALYDTLPGWADSLDLTISGHDKLAYHSRIAVTDISASEDRPPRLALYQNSPNPFNPVTSIRFTLESSGRVDLRAYDIAGREVAVIASGRMAAGPHEVAWNASGLASGVYFYVLRAGDSRISRKAVLLR
jgi:hypothetical protein